MKNKQIQTICRLYKQGKNTTQLSLLYGVHSTTIARYLRNNNIKLRDLSIAKRKYKINDNIFSNYSEKSCYWAGFIAADGCIEKRGNRIIIRLSDKDTSHLKILKKWIESDYPIRYYQKNVVAFGFCSSKITDILKTNFNITPCKSLTIKYPKQMPRKFDKYFIRGVFDGDGCLWKMGDKYRNKKYWSFQISSGSKIFLKTIQNILIKNCKINKTKILLDKNSKCYRLIYVGNIQVPRIIKYLSSSVYLLRKQELFNQVLNKL